MAKEATLTIPTVHGLHFTFGIRPDEKGLPYVFWHPASKAEELKMVMAGDPDIPYPEARSGGYSLSATSALFHMVYLGEDTGNSKFQMRFGGVYRKPFRAFLKEGMSLCPRVFFPDGLNPNPASDCEYSFPESFRNRCESSGPVYVYAESQGLPPLKSCLPAYFGSYFQSLWEYMRTNVYIYKSVSGLYSIDAGNYQMLADWLKQVSSR